MAVNNWAISGTAAQHLVRQVPLASPAETVDSVRTRLAGGAFESMEAVYVVDDRGHLRGLVPLPDLFAAQADRTLATIMIERPPAVHPDEDQERVAGLAVRRDLGSVPVVDSQGRFLGVVPAQALIAILRHEHIEDLHRLAGIRQETAVARRAIEAPPGRRARDRLPWLIVGLLGSVLATLVVSRFERLIEARVAVSFFVPGIVYLADAVGTQTEAIAVRGLSLSRASLRHLLAGELESGLLIGLVLGALSFPAVALGFGDLSLALAVALAILTAGAVAASIGLLFPWLLSHAGKDPAYGSGPIATIIQDVLSLFIYFTIAQVLVL